MIKQPLGQVVPKKGVDYWTEEDKEEIIQTVINGIEDKKQDYIDNANIYIEELTILKNQQLEDFNTNVENKTSEINTLVATEKENIETLADDKETELTTLANTLNSNINTNATNKTSTFDQNVQEKTSQFNSNAATQTLQFTQNVTTKEGEYNSNATTKLNEYNTNAEEKLADYNANADGTIEAYNTNVTTQTNNFNSNAEEKLESYNTNASGTIEAYNTNVTTKLNDFNSNATTKLEEYNTNATNKIDDYNSNDTTKLNNYNTNANTKLETYNTNATTKLDEYNLNAQEKTEQFNSSANAQKIVETRNELERVKNDILETGSDSNSYIHVEDSTMAELQELEVDGVCYQENNKPTPSNPSPISVIENNIEITSCNANLVKNLELGGIDSNDGNNFTSSTYMRTDYIRVIPNTYYTMFREEAVSSGAFAFYDKNKNYIGFHDGNGNLLSQDYVFQFLIPDGVYYMRFSINTNNVNYKVAVVFQGEKKAKYEEHAECKINVNLGDEFVGKLNDTFKDTIKVKFNDEDGKYHLILNKKIGKKVLKASNGWVIGTVDGYKCFKTTCIIGSYTIGASSHFSIRNAVVTSNEQGNYIKFGPGNQFNITFVHPHIDGTDITTIEDWKAFLNSNNVEVYYVLDTPYEVDLGAIEMPLSYDDTTNIFTDSDLLPKINATYYRNFTKTIQNLQVNENTLKQELISINNRLSALEAAQQT